MPKFVISAAIAAVLVSIAGGDAQAQPQGQLASTTAGIVPPAPMGSRPSTCTQAFQNSYAECLKVQPFKQQNCLVYHNDDLRICLQTGAYGSLGHYYYPLLRQ